MATKEQRFWRESVHPSLVFHKVDIYANWKLHVQGLNMPLVHVKYKCTRPSHSHAFPDPNIRAPSKPPLI